ncbi:hypothetical protein SELMODRAFT_424483 [Selaginella moellendorffii]|uniref:Uncharacterized protein n=1 Tax=Selaginella moellendorffii TaxID=88036 RepID=D8SQ12_SELML|nr:hypothetical protein SELMODRAFT_424483 [Selaginella moellendorffii]
MDELVEKLSWWDDLQTLSKPGIFSHNAEKGRILMSAKYHGRLVLVKFRDLTQSEPLDTDFYLRRFLHEVDVYTRLRDLQGDAIAEMFEYGFMRGTTICFVVLTYCGSFSKMVGKRFKSLNNDGVTFNAGAEYDVIMSLPQKVHAQGVHFGGKLNSTRMLENRLTSVVEFLLMHFREEKSLPVSLCFGAALAKVSKKNPISLGCEYFRPFLFLKAGMGIPFLGCKEKEWGLSSTITTRFKSEPKRDKSLIIVSPPSQDIPTQAELVHAGPLSHHVALQWHNFPAEEPERCPCRPWMRVLSMSKTNVGLFGSRGGGRIHCHFGRGMLGHGPEEFVETRALLLARGLQAHHLLKPWDPYRIVPASHPRTCSRHQRRGPLPSPSSARAPSRSKQSWVHSSATVVAVDESFQGVGNLRDR